MATTPYFLLTTANSNHLVYQYVFLNNTMPT